MFTRMPRFIGVGNPHQFWCESDFAFKGFERMFKGKSPFFVSTFAFKEDKITPIINNLFFDIDSYFSVRIPYVNVRKLKLFCEQYNVPYVINFSGGKGFHFFMIFKPVTPVSPLAKNKMANLMYSLQVHISEMLGIEAYDEPTYGRLRFLVRYPTSLYIRPNEETGAYEAGDFYCRNISGEDFDKGLKHIRKLIVTPGEVPETPKATMTMNQLAKKLSGFKLRERVTKKTDNIDIKIKRTGTVIPSITAVGVPCLQEIAAHAHPTHYERIELVSFLKLLGYTDTAICGFIRNRNWTRYNSSKTSYQVRTIAPRYPKCTFLRKSYGNLCKNCSLNNNGR